MSFLELAEKRYSVRQYSDRPVEKEKVDQILEAARLAPTAANVQPQRIIVLQSGEALEKLKKCTASHYHAPLAFIICYDKRGVWTRQEDGHTAGPIDATIVTTHMMLTAADIGLGSVFVYAFDPAKTIEEYNIPEQLYPLAILPVGYPADNAKPAPQHAQSKAVSDFTFYNDLSAWSEK